MRTLALRSTGAAKWCQMLKEAARIAGLAFHTFMQSSFLMCLKILNNVFSGFFFFVEILGAQMPTSRGTLFLAVR